MSVPARRRRHHVRKGSDLSSPETDRIVLRRRRCEEPTRRRARQGTGWRQVLLGLFVLAAAGPAWSIGAAIAERMHEEAARVAQRRQGLEVELAARSHDGGMAGRGAAPDVNRGAGGGAGTSRSAWASLWNTATGSGGTASRPAAPVNPYARSTAGASAGPAAVASALHFADHPASGPAVYVALAPKGVEKPASTAPARRVQPADVTAGTATWTGASAGTSANWTTTGNWASNNPPAPGGFADVVFGATPAVATASNVNVNHSINSLTFQANTPGYVLTGSSGVKLTIANGITDASANPQQITVPIVTTGAQTWNVANAAGSLSVNSLVTGGGGLLKTGAGALTLGGTGENTFGGLTVTGGTVTLAKTDLDLAVSNPITVGNATSPGAAGSVAVQTLFNGQTGVSANLTLYSDGVFDVAGHTNGLGSVTMTGGELRLGAGKITVNAVGVGIGPITTNAYSASALITSTNHSNSIDLANTTVTATVARGTATYDLDVSAGFTNGTLDKDGPGVMRLSGTTNDMFVVSLGAGTLALASDTALGTTTFGGMPTAPSFFGLNGGTLVADGGDRTIPNPTLLIADSTLGASVDGTAHKLTFTSTLNSSDNLTLTVNNNADTTLQGGVNIDTSTLTVAGTGKLIVTGVVAESGKGGALAKGGTGTLVLDNKNTYTGGTTLNAGTLDVQNDGALGTGKLVINGGTLTNNETADGTPTGFAVQANIANAITLAGNLDHGQSNNYLTLSGDITLTGGTHTISASDTGFFPGGRSMVTFSGAISSTEAGTGLTFANSAVDNLIVSGTTSNTYTGLTTVDNAQVFLQKNPGQTAVTGDITVQNGGTVFTAGGQFNAAGTTNLTVNTGGTYDGSGVFDEPGNETVASLNGDSTGTASIGNQVTRGSLTVGQGTMNGLIQDGTVVTDFAPRTPNAVGLTGGTLIKNTEGTLTLTHNNTYTGGTTVAGGKFFVNNVPVAGVGSGTGTGAVFVQPTQTGTWLGGTGAIGGDTTVGGFAPLLMRGGSAGPQVVAGMATLTPGVGGAGILTFNANLTLTALATAELDIAGTDPGTGYDQVKVGGNLSLAGNLTLVLGTGFAPTKGEKFFVFDLTGRAGTVAGAFENAGPGGTFTDVAGNEYTINYADTDPADGDGVTNDVSLTLTALAVPEPGTWAMVAAGAAAGLALWLRRRRVGAAVGR